MKEQHPLIYWLLAVAVASAGLTDAGEAYYRWAGYLAVNLFNLDSAINMMAESAPRQGLAVPLTLVAIDDATTTRWECPNTTPLDKLAGLLTTITKAGPAAVVVDVDLSHPCGLNLSGEMELASFLNAYAGDTPLVFVKRIIEDADGRLIMQPSHFDQSFATNQRLSWAHAVYAHDSDGVARRWMESVGVCAEADIETLPSVPVRVLSVAEWRKRAPFARPAANLEHKDSCTRQSVQGKSHIVVFEHQGRMASGIGTDSLLRVPAWQILDREIQRDDTRLLFDRVIVIGNSHRYAGDMWRAPVGEIAGVELIAQTMRFAAEQMDENDASVKHYAVGLFAVYCIVGFILRPLVASILDFIITWVVVWVAVGTIGFISIADSVERALLLSLAFLGMLELVKLARDFRAGPGKLLLSKYLQNKPNHTT